MSAKLESKPTGEGRPTTGITMLLAIFMAAAIAVVTLSACGTSGTSPLTADEQRQFARLDDGFFSVCGGKGPEKAWAVGEDLSPGWFRQEHIDYSTFAKWYDRHCPTG